MRRTVILALFAVCLIGCSYKERSIDVDAKVLSVDQHILHGTIGASYGLIAGSAQGEIANDVIKLGIDYTVDGNRFLEDIEVNHATCAAFANTDTIPMRLEIKSWGDTSDSGTLTEYLNGSSVGYVNLTPKYGWDLANGK